jgi:DUF4097 and DUF4098 domain-containing protein YvlB
MNRQSRLATWWGAVLGTICALLVSSLAHASDNSGAFTEEFHKTYSITAGGRVHLENINGAAHISAWDRNEVKVDAIKRARSKERLDEAKIVVDAASDHVSIRTEYPHHDRHSSREDWDNPADVEYTLTVPRGVQLDGVNLINGSLDVQGISGEVEASCINGRLTARGLSGRAKLSTINNRVDAQFEQLSTAPIELSSINGTVLLTLASDAKADLEASTVHGPIRNDFGLHVNNHHFVGHDLRGELGGGGTPIRLNNVNGEIEIRHAGDGRTLSPARDASSSDDKI